MGKEFKVGDKVTLFHGMGASQLTLTTVEAISPKRGDIKLAGMASKYDRSGRMIGGDVWNHAYIEHTVPEHEDIIERQRLVYRLKDVDWADPEIDLETLRGLMNTCKDIYGRQKRERQEAIDKANARQQARKEELEKGGKS